MDQQDLAGRLDKGGGDALYITCSTASWGYQQGRFYARIRTVLRYCLHHLFVLSSHQGIHCSLKTAKRRSFHDAGSGLCLWNPRVDSADRWVGIFSTELALVGISIDFPGNDHALSRHHLSRRSAPAEDQPGSSRRVILSTLSFRTRTPALLGDGNAWHAGARDLGDRHLEQLRQKLERFAVPAGLWPGRIDGVIVSV